MNAGNTPEISKQPYDLWREGLVDKKAALRILKNEALWDKLPIEWFYHLTKQISDEEFFDIFLVSREMWLEQVDKQYGKSPVLKHKIKNDKAVPSYAEALTMLFQFKGNKEQLIWVCRCYPEFIPYAYTFHKNILTENDFIQLALFNHQARESIMHFKDLSGVHEAITTKLRSHLVLLRQEERGLSKIKLSNYNWMFAFTYIQHLFKPDFLAKISEETVCNNLAYFAARFPLLSLEIYNSPGLQKYVAKFTKQQQIYILRWNIIWAKKFHQQGLLNPDYLGFDNFVEILVSHHRTLVSEVLLNKDSAFLKAVGLKSKKIALWILTPEFRKIFNLFNKKDFLEICTAHPEVACKYFTNPVFTQEILAISIELLIPIIEKTPEVYYLICTQKRFFPILNQLNKFILSEPESGMRGSNEQKRIQSLQYDLAASDTAYYFDQNDFIKQFGERLQPHGNCAGFVIDFLRWCSKHPEQDYQLYAKKIHRVMKNGSESLEYSNFVDRVHFFQLNQSAYFKNPKVFKIENNTAQAFSDLINKILNQLHETPYLCLAISNHCMAIARNPDGRITVFDSNSYLQTFDLLQDWDDFKGCLQDCFDNSCANDSFTVEVYSISYEHVKKPLPLTRQDKSNDQKSETKQESPDSYPSKLCMPIMQAMSNKEYDKAWSLIGELEKNLSDKANPIDIEFHDFLKKVIVAIKLDLGIAFRTLRQGLTVDTKFRDPKTGHRLIDRAKQDEYPSGKLINLLEQCEVKLESAQQHETMQDEQKTVKAPLPVLNPLKRKVEDNSNSTTNTTNIEPGDEPPSKRPKLV